MIERDRKQLLLFDIHLNGQRPVEELWRALESAGLEIPPCRFGVDRRHRQEKVKCLHDLVDAAISPADGIDESSPSERAVRGHAQNTGSRDERGHRLQSGIENVGDHPFTQIGIDVFGTGLPVDRRKTDGDAGKASKTRGEARVRIVR